MRRYCLSWRSLRCASVAYRQYGPSDVVLAMAAGAGRLARPLFEDKFVKAVGVISFVGDDLIGGRPRIKSHAGAISFGCPGPSAKRTGRPSASTTAWSSLPKPPRERPRAWACGPPPLTPSARGLCMGTYHGGGDRESLQIAIGRDGLQYPIKDTGLDPSIVVPLGRLETRRDQTVFRETAPADPRARQPQHHIQKTTTIFGDRASPCDRHARTAPVAPTYRLNTSPSTPASKSQR